MEKNMEERSRYSVGEYTSDPFLQLHRDEGIERHFTV